MKPQKQPAHLSYCLCSLVSSSIVISVDLDMPGKFCLLSFCLLLVIQSFFEGQSASWDVAKKEQNRTKNRYGNIIACKKEVLHRRKRRGKRASSFYWFCASWVSLRLWEKRTLSCFVWFDRIWSIVRRHEKGHFQWLFLPHWNPFMSFLPLPVTISFLVLILSVAVSVTL